MRFDCQEMLIQVIIDTSMEELSYKTVLGILAVWMFLVRMYYQERARWPRTHTAVPLGERLLVSSTSLWLIPAAIYILSPWLDGLDMNLPDPVRKGGAVLLAFSVLLYWWAHAVLNRNLSPYVEIKIHHHLITSGPYAHIRHPIYAAVFLSGLGLALLSANWLLALVYFLPVIALYRLRVNAEEQLMLYQFGEEYRAYMARTGRLLPRLRSR